MNSAVGSLLRPRFLFSVLLLVLLLDPVHPLTHKDWLTLRTERAYILSSYKHLMTSSTLSWARVDDIVSGRIPTSRLVLVEDSAVCRVRDGNEQRAGRTDLSGSCLAGPGLKKHTEYQVLVDGTSLSRYKWRYWDMYTMPQTGTVAYNTKTYVGSLRTETGREIIGELDFNRGLNGNIKSYVTENSSELSVQGLALVEIEPVKYIIDSVDLNTGRGKIKKRDIVLGKISLSREKDETEPEDWKYIEGLIKFSEPVSQSWDHIPGTSKGIDTETRLRNRTYQFPWGMEWNGDEVGERRVGANLQPGTKIDITLEGVLFSGDVPYTAVFIQLYEDDVRKETNIEGLVTLTSVESISIVQGVPSYLETGLPAPRHPKPTPVPTNPAPANTVLPEDTEYPEYTQDSIKDGSKDYMGDERTDTDSRLPATLYPPPEPTTRKPNPLRRFYPEEEEKVDKDKVTAAKFLENVSSGKNQAILSGGPLLCILYVCLLDLY